MTNYELALEQIQRAKSDVTVRIDMDNIVHAAFFRTEITPLTAARYCAQQRVALKLDKSGMFLPDHVAAELLATQMVQRGNEIIAQLWQLAKTGAIKGAADAYKMPADINLRKALEIYQCMALCVAVDSGLTDWTIEQINLLTKPQRFTAETVEYVVRKIQGDEVQFPKVEESEYGK